MRYLASFLLFAFTKIVKTATQTTPGCCSAWFFAPPSAMVTRLQSTLLVPPLSQELGIHFIWPGLETRSGNFVFQAVLGDDQPPGYWSLATWYGPDSSSTGAYHKLETTSSPILVYEGDLLTTSLVLDEQTNVWSSTWFLEPGVISKDVGIEERSGRVKVDLEDMENVALTDVIFEIELQEMATWDFGPVLWRDIWIEVNSSTTSWCQDSRLGVYNFWHEMADPVATLNVNGSSSCYIASLSFVLP